MIVFQRGLGGESRAWVREADGRERRLSTTERTERRPRMSSDGRRVALLALTETGRKAVALSIDGSGESTVSTDATLEDLAWGGTTQIALSTRNGVYVVPVTGSTYLNLASRSHGDIDWSANGTTITIAEQRDVVVSYNGDPIGAWTVRRTNDKCFLVVHCPGCIR